MEAAELVDGHLPGLERGLFLIFDQLADHEVFAEDFLIGEAGGVDFAELAEIVAPARELLVVGLDGVVGELIVEPRVADGGSKFRRMAEVVFPDLGEKVVKGFAAGFDVRRGGRGLCGKRARGNRQDAEGDEKKLGEDGRELAQFHGRVQGTGCRAQIAVMRDLL